MICRRTLRRLVALASAMLLTTAAARAQETVERPDLMSLARGVLPVAIDTGGTDLRTAMEHAIAVIDGNPVVKVMTPKPGPADTALGLIYALPGPTVFDRFAVPGVKETPSPSQTFFAAVRVLGSAAGPQGPFVLLAEGRLQARKAGQEATELGMADDRPAVRWVKVELAGGLSIERDATFFEFSELIGNGAQDEVALSDRFTGSWKGRGVDITLQQDGATVSGCYDKTGTLTGTVDGAVLTALGQTQSGIGSQFVLLVDEEGALRGLSSTNGAPFRIYAGEPASASSCAKPKAPVLGCGAILHGIGFDYDSDKIRPQSRPLIEALADALRGVDAARIEIVGHSSSEGSEAYNLDLSQRRAQSVVAALAGLGLDAGRLGASGRGEAEPIASNVDEAGRALNRRVEVHCSG